MHLNNHGEKPRKNLVASAAYQSVKNERLRLWTQVNGAFELSSNRRNIWWADSHGAGADRSAWNLALLKVTLNADYSCLLSPLQFS